MPAQGHFISRFLQLPSRQQAMAVEALFTLVVVSIALRCLPYRSWRAELGTPAGSPPAADAIATAREVGRSVVAVARNLPGRPQCLAQALAARAMLKRRGIDSELNLGVNKDRAAINAHAWLAVGKQIVTGGPDVSAFSAFGKSA